jgi:hypothetical protein
MSLGHIVLCYLMSYVAVGYVVRVVVTLSAKKDPTMTPERTRFLANAAWVLWPYFIWVVVFSEGE